MQLPFLIAHPTQARRYRPRSGTRAVCRKGPPGPGSNLALSVVDLSDGGLRLLLAEPLIPGEEVAVELEGDAGCPVKLPARVVWCHERPAGGHWAGFAFDGRLAASDLRVLAQTGSFPGQ